MTKNTSTTMNDIPMNGLFILPSVGVLRKTHPCHGTSKDGQVRVIYPNERVSLLQKKGVK
jgi:hypothetical protein